MLKPKDWLDENEWENKPIEARYPDVEGVISNRSDYKTSIALDAKLIKKICEYAMKHGQDQGNSKLSYKDKTFRPITLHIKDAESPLLVDIALAEHDGGNLDEPATCVLMPCRA